jgi:hypothetical protein
MPKQFTIVKNNLGMPKLSDLPNNVIPIGTNFKILQNETTICTHNLHFKLCTNKYVKPITMPAHKNYNNLYDLTNYYPYHMNLPIGEYKLYMANEHKHIMKIFVVFNPYDETMFGKLDDEFIKENVFSTSIMHYRNINKKWDLDQFHPLIYKYMAYYINQLTDEQRLDPAYICRYMTDKCNSCDNSNEEVHDLLCGRWGNSDNDYADGIEPTYWTSSIDIIKNFKSNNDSAVKYGQCWVFSYLLMTMLRNVCIPTRFIYNENSAHIKTTQTQYNNILFTNYKNKKNKYYNGSIWNFHCWNEAYFKNDWHVIDATPQELSDNDFQCGPCSVTTIKDYNKQLLSDLTLKQKEIISNIKKVLKDPDFELNIIQKINPNPNPSPYPRSNSIPIPIPRKNSIPIQYDLKFIAGETFYLIVSKHDYKPKKYIAYFKYSTPYLIGTSSVTELKNHYY